jgi:hypothetical protein
MRWLRAGTGALALMVLTGCPSEFGKEGRVSKAVRRDSLEIVSKYCSEKDYKTFCAGGREQTPECLDKCGQ